MNALPLISHRLLASAVAEHRSARRSGAVEDKPIIIHCNDKWATATPPVEEPVSIPSGAAARLLEPTPISASWPFFE